MAPREIARFTSGNTPSPGNSRSGADVGARSGPSEFEGVESTLWNCDGIVTGGRRGAFGAYVVDQTQYDEVEWRLADAPPINNHPVTSVEYVYGDLSITWLIDESRDLDVETRPDESEFRITLPAGMRVAATDEKLPGAQFMLGDAEVVGLGDLRDLYQRTQDRAMARDRSSRPAPTNTRVVMWVAVLSLALAAVVVVVLLLRRRRAREAPV